MSSEDEANSKLVKWYVRLAIISAFLLAFFWPLGSFFFWIFFGAGSYFTFLAFYYRPRPKPEATREEYARHEWPQPDQGSTVRIAPKNIKLIVVVVVIATFFFLLILMIIGFATGEDSSPQNTEEISIDENRELLLSDPNNIDALINLGNSFYATSEYDSALVYYERAIKADPQNSSGLYNKGLTLSSKKEYQKSMEVLRLCISLHPENTDALIVMGDNYYSQDQFEQAMTWYKQAYDKGVRTSGLLNVMAYIYDQQKQNSEAIRLYKETLQQDSSLVDIYNRLAEMEPEHATWYKKKAEAWK